MKRERRRKEKDCYSNHVHDWPPPLAFYCTDNRNKDYCLHCHRLNNSHASTPVESVAAAVAAAAVDGAGVALVVAENDTPIR